jgi:hypothetical protein
MVTIQHLEVRFDVAGDSEEASFARMFQEYIARWSRLQMEAAARQKLSDEERCIGEPDGGRSCH